MAGLEFLRPLTITILLLQKIGAAEIPSFKVANAVRFDPHQTAEWLGDVDVVIDLRPGISDSAKFRQQCDHRRHLAEEQGRAFSTAIDWATWPKKEVVLQLKARSRSLRSTHISALVACKRPI
jgi:hypothetical protein